MFYVEQQEIGRKKGRGTTYLPKLAWRDHPGFWEAWPGREENGSVGLHATNSQLFPWKFHGILKGDMIIRTHCLLLRTTILHK